MLEVLTMWSVCLCFCLVLEDLPIKAAILQMFLPHVRNWSSEWAGLRSKVQMLAGIMFTTLWTSRFIVVDREVYWIYCTRKILLLATHTLYNITFYKMVMNNIITLSSLEVKRIISGGRKKKIFCVGFYRWIIWDFCEEYSWRKCRCCWWKVKDQWPDNWGTGLQVTMLDAV